MQMQNDEGAPVNLGTQKFGKGNEKIIYMFQDINTRASRSNLLVYGYICCDVL
jgi:hypothetical protein